jgi:hypothetical protein
MPELREKNETTREKVAKRHKRDAEFVWLNERNGD